MSSGICKPLETVSSTSCDLLSESAVVKLKEKLSPLVNSLTPLNSKNNAEPTSEDVNYKSKLKCFVREDPELDEAMESAFVMASNMLTMSTNYLVGGALFRNPERYAEKLAVVGGGSEDFRKIPSLKELKKFLTGCCVVCGREEEGC